MLFADAVQSILGDKSMKKLVSIAAIAAVFAGVTTSAFADSNDTLSGVSIRIGAFQPLQDATRNATSNNWIAGGVDYKLSNAKLMNLSQGFWSISLDYTERQGFRNMPLMLNYVSGKQVYWSVGVGAGFDKFVDDAGASNERIRLAYGASLGYNFQNTEIPLFLELKYLGSEQPRVAGLGLYLGFRF